MLTKFSGVYYTRKQLCFSYIPVVGMKLLIMYFFMSMLLTDRVIVNPDFEFDKKEYKKESDASLHIIIMFMVLFERWKE